jgi:hypothetical protein
MRRKAGGCRGARVGGEVRRSEDLEESKLVGFVEKSQDGSVLEREGERR